MSVCSKAACRAFGGWRLLRFGMAVLYLTACTSGWLGTNATCSCTRTAFLFLSQVGNARGRTKPDPVQCFQLLQASGGAGGCCVLQAMLCGGWAWGAWG